MLVRPAISKETVRMNRQRGDEVGVTFACDLLSAACICDTLRAHDAKVGDYPTRVYVFRKAWTKVAGNVTLSIVLDGKPVLNPDLFPRLAELPPLTAPKRKF